MEQASELAPAALRGDIQEIMDASNHSDILETSENSGVIQVSLM